MSVLAQELDRQLATMDALTAQRAERLVRDALELAKPAGAKGWPAGYFEQTAGALAGEKFERPPQGAVEAREDW